MSYQWPKRLIDKKDGIPYEKKPPVYLEKTNTEGEVIAADTFTTQEDVDKAWANGFHTPGKPETRDVLSGSVEEFIKDEPIIPKDSILPEDPFLEEKTKKSILGRKKG